MSKYKTAKYILSFLLIIFTVLTFLPYLNRQEKLLQQDVHCIKAVCIDDGKTDTCTNLPSQVGHFIITHDKNGSTISIKLNGAQCY